MSEGCRASFWYDNDLIIRNCEMFGIKAIRECNNFTIESCTINSQEFGWLSKNGVITNSSLISEYPFFKSSNLKMDKFFLEGKYSFQYTENLEIHNSELKTKDAFWHSKNVTVYDSVIKGEYLAWYSENLKLVRCKITGTQPLCYCKNLTLIDCEMIDCDLSFEKSEVYANIIGTVTSVKNPLSGKITAENYGEIILDEFGVNSECEILITESVSV